MKFYAMRFVSFANQVSHFVSQNFPKRHRISSNHSDFQFAFAQRPRHFESDEATADDDRALSGLGLFDDSPAVRQRSQIKTCGKSAPGTVRWTGSAPVASNSAP